MRGNNSSNLLVSRTGSVDTKYIKFRNYFLVILLILFEDSPFFLTADKRIFWFIIFVLLLIMNRRSGKIVNQKIFLIMISVWVIILFQYILFGGISSAAIYKPILIFYTPFLVFILMGLKYYKYLFNIIYFIAVYTLIIYLLQTFNPQFNEFLFDLYESIYPFSFATWHQTILLYTFPTEWGFFFRRNAGIFHEPGAYSIYLMLAIIINTYFTGKPLNWKNIFLSVVLLTTFSTAGYLMLFVFYGYIIIKSKIHFVFKWAIILPSVILMMNVYQKSTFLSEKVETQFEDESYAVKKNIEDRGGRFYSIGISAKSILSSPVVGQGVLTVNKYDVGESGRYGYGFMGLLAMYGLIFGFFYMIFFYKGFLVLSVLYNMPRLYSFVAFIIINLGLLTQTFFFHTPFIYFLIIGVFFPMEKILKNQVKT